MCNPLSIWLIKTIKIQLCVWNLNLNWNPSKKVNDLFEIVLLSGRYGFIDGYSIIKNSQKNFSVLASTAINLIIIPNSAVYFQSHLNEPLISLYNFLFHILANMWLLNYFAIRKPSRRRRSISNNYWGNETWRGQKWPGQPLRWMRSVCLNKIAEIKVTYLVMNLIRI